MKSTVDTKTVILLELTIEEASWLRGFIQNYPYQEPERPDYQKFREDLFRCLDSRLSQVS